MRITVTNEVHSGEQKNSWCLCEISWRCTWTDQVQLSQGSFAHGKVHCRHFRVLTLTHGPMACFQGPAWYWMMCERRILFEICQLWHMSNYMQGDWHKSCFQSPVSVAILVESKCFSRVFNPSPFHSFAPAQGSLPSSWWARWRPRKGLHRETNTIRVAESAHTWGTWIIVEFVAQSKHHKANPNVIRCWNSGWSRQHGEFVINRTAHEVDIKSAPSHHLRSLRDASNSNRAWD